MSVKSALHRIAAVDDSITETDSIEQQYDMYRKTLVALEDIEADDDDEGVTVITDWIVDQIETTGDRPSSRSVRQRAAKFCRENGFDVSDNSWLGR